MASLCCNTTTMLVSFFFFFVSLSLSVSVEEENKTQTPFSEKSSFSSLSLPLSLITSQTSPALPLDDSKTKTTTTTLKKKITSPPSLSLATIRSKIRYSTALIVSLPIGTPPQTQQMVIDTGSQLSWIQCDPKKKKMTKSSTSSSRANTTSFDPSLSSSFSVLPCNHPVCKPRILDFTLPTDCDRNRLCHYSYFYADGTVAEGNLVKEKFTFSSSQSTLPVILGCADDSNQSKGILGMNLGRLSFASQAKISKFSYCVPARTYRAGFTPTGSFYLGQNPHSAGFSYVSLQTFSASRRSLPNLDPLAYTVVLRGVRIGGKRLNISEAAFKADASGSGQTIVDSGSEFTYFVGEAYDKVREEIVRLVGPRLKRGYVYGGICDMCFDGNPIEIGRVIGDMALEFDQRVEVVIEKERVLADVGDGVHCVGIGRSDLLGIASNIIGNFHQQNQWVEFDIGNRRVGFAKADCSRSV